MLAVAPEVTYGHSAPRIAPPRPMRSELAAFVQAAKDMDIDLMPWQIVAAEYITATGPGGVWAYPDVSVIVARQNGKTELLLPFIVSRLRLGRRVMHSAQNRELPREVFGRVADFMVEDGHLLKKPRYANGQEEVRHESGGVYRIVAPTRGGARGPSNDDLIVDEVREFTDFDFIAAAKPTLNASRSPQMLYLSNAGDDDSVVLNALRKRSDDDPSLAYLEWSANPDRSADDREGWREANPGIGHLQGSMTNLENSFRSYVLSGQSAIFETEHLCRWVPTMRPRLVDDFAWMRCRTSNLDPVIRPSIGISMDPAGTRASVVMAWRQADKSIALRELFDVAVDETGVRQLGEDALKMTRKWGWVTVGYDDLTDRDLARHWKKKAKAIIGKDFVNATDAFVRAVERGDVHWVEAAHITDDLAMTSRKDNTESGTFHAVKSRENVPITASLAAIRAFWLASASVPSGPLRVY